MGETYEHRGDGEQAEDVMNNKQKRAAAGYLEHFVKEIRAGKVDWYAITVKYPNSRISIHTEGAPKRPKGMS